MSNNSVNKGKFENVAVAIDKDKGSQFGFKWAVDNVLGRSQGLTLLHVKPGSGQGQSKRFDTQTNELFLPFRCFCRRKEVKCNEVVVDDTDVARGIIEYVNANGVDALVFGSASRGSLARFKSSDIPGVVSKGAPDFCTVYVIVKGKISSIRNATSPLPAKTTPVPSLTQSNAINNKFQDDRTSYSYQDEIELKSPFTRNRGLQGTSYNSSVSDTDISFASNGRSNTDFPSMCSSESGMSPRNISTVSTDYEGRSFGSSPHSGTTYREQDFSSCSQDSGRTPYSPQAMDDLESEMNRLRLELKNTMEMYSSACKEALTAKQKARDFNLWKSEEKRRLEEARLAEEAAMALVEKERAKCKAALEAAEAAQRIAELEAKKRVNAEMRIQKEADERKKATQSISGGRDLRYRRYTIEEIEEATNYFATNLKIGEGGYGPVYRCYLDHTPVAIKVLRPDAAQGRSQFQQEVEVLSCIRHPNMVLLVGACPEYGCLVYEYMASGSLDDCLFRRGKNPPLSWQLRFKIAAEIATGLLFLHQNKPEPIVHRDLKPGNILLDRNYVSKISDVGLARLVPPSVADSVTQYRMTSTAGTFCYIDPEYQQTGMLGIKSDVYSLGIMLLQIITARPPMGLTHHVESSIENGTFKEMLDPQVTDWPVEEALVFAKLALQCAELRRKDRPHLGQILPELNRLRELAEESLMGRIMPSYSPYVSSHHQDVMSDQPSFGSTRSRTSSTSSNYSK